MKTVHINRIHFFQIINKVCWCLACIVFLINIGVIIFSDMSINLFALAVLFGCIGYLSGELGKTIELVDNSRETSKRDVYISLLVKVCITIAIVVLSFKYQ